MLKRWVKKAENSDWEEWFPPCGMACFLTKESFEAYRNRQWAITSMVHQVKISDEKPNG